MRLIDADALEDNLEATIKVYKRNAKYDESLLRQVNALKLELKIIKDAPTIEPKRGRWVTHGVAKGSEICDQCGFVQLRHRVNNYCPNCGARMEASDD